MTELSSPRVWSCHDLPYWLMHTGHKPGPWSWSQAEVEELKWCYMVTVWHNGLVFCHRCKASGSGSQWAVFLWCWSHIWATLSLNPGQPHDPDVLLKPSVSQYWKYSSEEGPNCPTHAKVLVSTTVSTVPWCQSTAALLSSPSSPFGSRAPQQPAA